MGPHRKQPRHLCAGNGVKGVAAGCEARNACEDPLLLLVMLVVMVLRVVLSRFAIVITRLFPAVPFL